MHNILKNILTALFIVLGFFAFQVKAQTIDDFVIRNYLTDEIVRLQQQISALIVQPRVAGATTISTMTVAQTSGSYAFKAQEEKAIGSIVLKAVGNDITLSEINATIRGQLSDNFAKMSLVDKATGVVLSFWDSSQPLAVGPYAESYSNFFDLSSSNFVIPAGQTKSIDVVLKAKDSVTNSTQYFQIIGQSIKGVDVNGQTVKGTASINLPFISQASSVLDSQIAQLLSQARTIYTQLLACRTQKGLPYMPFPIPVQNNKEEYLISIHSGLQALQADSTTCQSSEDLNAKIVALQTQINQLWQQIIVSRCSTGVTLYVAPLADKNIYITNLLAKIAEFQTLLTKCQQSTKYACVSGNCVVSTGGLYGSLSACQASCGQASKYSVELVSTNITKISTSGVADQADAEIKIRIKNLSGLNIYIDKTADWGAGISGFKIGLSNGLQKIISASVTANVGDYIPGYQTGEYTIKAHILPNLNGYYSLALNFFRIREPSGDVLAPFSPSIYKTSNLYLSTTIQKVCAKEGESWIYDNSSAPNNPNNKSVNCCSGLLKVGGGAIYDSSCRIIGGTAGGGSGTCVKCGNGICDSGENQCNCPSDCKTAFIRKLEMSSSPSDTDKIIRLSSSGATYDVELGKINLKATGSNIKLSQLIGTISVYNRLGNFKTTNSVVTRLRLYDNNGLQVGVVMPDIYGNFVFTDNSTLPQIINETYKTLIIKADIAPISNNKIVQGDYISWRIIKVVGVSGNNHVYTTNIINGKKTHLYFAYSQ